MKIKMAGAFLLGKIQSPECVGFIFFRFFVEFVCNESVAP